MPSQYLMHQDGITLGPEGNENHISPEKAYFDLVMTQAISAYTYLRGTVECHLPNAQECPDGSFIFGGVTEQQFIRAFEDARAKDS